MNSKIQHFGILIKKSERNKINRDNYAVIDKKSSIWAPSRCHQFATVEERKQYYDDEDCKIHSDSWCEKHREKCLINFDKNMAFFKRIPKDEFEKALHSLINSNKRIRQILNLNECKELCGIYILVLDEYKQIYIGQSQNIKKRIIQHWSNIKPFDRLLFGKIDNSVLSIDSFGALDTTRIFILQTDRLDYYEAKLQKKVSAEFKLNRIAGGIPIDRIDLWSKVIDSDHRNF